MVGTREIQLPFSLQMWLKRTLETLDPPESSNDTCVWEREDGNRGGSPTGNRSIERWMKWLTSHPPPQRPPVGEREEATISRRYVRSRQQWNIRKIPMTTTRCGSIILRRWLRWWLKYHIVHISWSSKCAPKGILAGIANKKKRLGGRLWLLRLRRNLSC